MIQTGAPRHISARAERGSPKRSNQPARGTVEPSILISGAARVGPVAAPVELARSVYLAYSGDVPHQFGVRRHL